MTLAEFVLARTAERIATARRLLATDRDGVLLEPASDDALDLAEMVLRQAEATHAIVAEHVNGGAWVVDDVPVQHTCAVCRAPFPCPTLRALGLPYADHAGYRPEWRP